MGLGAKILGYELGMGHKSATSLVSIARRNPLDRDVGGSIPHMGKTQCLSKTANFDKFFVSNPFAYFN
jgi:hypothetical protein